MQFSDHSQTGHHCVYHFCFGCIVSITAAQVAHMFSWWSTVKFVWFDIPGMQDFQCIGGFHASPGHHYWGMV